MPATSRLWYTIALLLVLSRAVAAQHAPSLSLDTGLGVSRLRARAMNPESVFSGSLGLALSFPVTTAFGADLSLSVEGSRRHCNCDDAILRYSVDGEIMRSVPLALYGGVALLGAHADIGSVRVIASGGRGYLASVDDGGPAGSRVTVERIDFVVYPAARLSLLLRGEGGALADYGGQRLEFSAVKLGMRFR